MKKMIVLEPSLIEVEKYTISGVMSLTQQEIEKNPVPKREESSSDDEYKILFIEYMLNAIKKAEKTKKELFIKNLERYNNFLTKKQEVEEQIRSSRETHEKEIDRNSKKKGKIILAEIITTLLLPAYFPIIAGVGLAQYLSTNVAIKYHLEGIQNEEDAKEVLKKMQDELSDLSFLLRDDYHRSKEEFGKLRQRALLGENVLQDVLNLMDPERLSLPKVEARIEETNDKDNPKIIHLVNNKDKKEVTI